MIKHGPSSSKEWPELDPALQYDEALSGCPMSFPDAVRWVVALGKVAFGENRGF